VDLYTFVVTDFVIHDTRALHNDTLHLSHSAYVDGDMVANHLISMGDFDNGGYHTADYVPAGQSPGLADVVINDPEAKVAFVFQLVNAGNVPADTLTGRMAASADQLAGITAGLAGAGAAGIGDAVTSAAFPIGLLLEAFANVWAWLTVDCDGPVAVDQLSGPRYVIDATTDNGTGLVQIQRRYPGTDSPTGCGGNSNYEVTWSLQHRRRWVPVTDPVNGQFTSDTALSAVTHYGAVHAFGVGANGLINHARTFTGAAWSVDTLGSFRIGGLPVTAVSFDDRLWVLGVLADGSISTLAYTVDGGTWVQDAAGPPAGLLTAEPVAAAVFRHRLCLLARDSATGHLRMTSTADLQLWTPWADVPQPGIPAVSPVAAAVLAGPLLTETLHIFGVFNTGKPPINVAVMHNSTTDGVTWAGWNEVESGVRPPGAPLSDQPLDVAAGVFRDRICLASRWESASALETTCYLAENFSADGVNWSGWRGPASDVIFQPAATAGLAAVGHHLYLFTPLLDTANSQATNVWVH